MKHYILLFVFALFGNGVFACDICGCSAQGTSLGLLPGATNHFVGLRYNFRHFMGVHPPLDGDPGGQISNDYFQSAEIWGRYSPIKRLQLYGFIPFNYSTQNESDMRRVTYGLGDVSILVSGVIIQSNDTLRRGKMKHEWTMGIAVKAPTGASHRIDSKLGVVLPNMQPGTGSWDFSLVSNYHFVHHNWGLNLNASYRYNLPNKFRYQFGSRILLSAHALRKLMFPTKGFTMIPQMGFILDYAQKDYQNLSKNELNDFSGGYFLHGEIRLDCYVKNFGFNISAALPVAQNYGQGYVTSKYRIELGIKILFQSKNKKNEKG